MYYRLQSHCVLVTGAQRGAIYDFTSGKVYSINRSALELLQSCQTEQLEDLLDIHSPEASPLISFLDNLTKKGLGGFYFSEPAEPQLPIASRDDSDKLSFIWLELTAKCNNRCLHCYAASGPTLNTDCVPHERWLSVIVEARKAGATAIQLIGGEPLLYARWRELVIKAHEEGYNFIEIFTNATLIDKECIDFFKAYNVNVATTLYADNAAVHDSVTLNPGSFTKTITAIQNILAEKIPLRIASIIMKANEPEAENIVRLCEKLGVEGGYPDVVRPTGRGDDKDLLPEHYTSPGIKPPFYTDKDSFGLARQYHCCLQGKIAVTADGDIIPCIFARDRICGNILFQPLAEIISGQKLQSCWCVTKDQIEKCKDCEYRYACSDCRPLAQGSDPDKCWLAPTAGCSYNPYSGKWEGA